MTAARLDRPALWAAVNAELMAPENADRYFGRQAAPQPAPANAAATTPPGGAPTPAPAATTGLTERERFARCLREILKHEGGYSDHPRDNGGATNLGVTLATARAHGLDIDGDGDVDKADMRLLKIEHVEPVYLEGFWRAAGCQHIPAGLDLMTFDVSVNSGPRRAVRFLQEALGVSADGAFGPLTKTALAAAHPRTVIKRYATIREEFYRSLDDFDVFGKGWLRRLAEVKAKSEAWA